MILGLIFSQGRFVTTKNIKSLTPNVMCDVYVSYKETVAAKGERDIRIFLIRFILLKYGSLSERTLIPVLVIMKENVNMSSLVYSVLHSCLE